jgi:pantoate--beta-alanine ligase
MIEVFSKASDLRKKLKELKSARSSVGFVPTMGALHEGHLTLAKKAKKNNDIVVVSIFVNPTQFNDKKDLDNYPRHLDNDVALLESIGVDFVYAPEINDVYPQGLDAESKINLGGLDQVMEGKFRPGHFEGVAQVVKRLLDIVMPDKLYMGQKDFQQAAIVQHMISDLGIPVQLVICPIVREPHGLAMSSRNVRLSDKGRQTAGIIYKTLKAVKRMKGKKPLTEVNQMAFKRLNQPPFQAEYFEVVDGKTLKSLANWSDAAHIVACVAVNLEGVRLIDNIVIQS